MYTKYTALHYSVISTLYFLSCNFTCGRIEVARGCSGCTCIPIKKCWLRLCLVVNKFSVNP